MKVSKKVVEIVTIEMSWEQAEALRSLIGRLVLDGSTDATKAWNFVYSSMYLALGELGVCESKAANRGISLPKII